MVKKYGESGKVRPYVVFEKDDYTENVFVKVDVKKYFSYMRLLKILSKNTTLMMDEKSLF